MSNAFEHSAEVRWFLPSHRECPELLKWFRLGDRLAVHEEAHDPAKISGEPFILLEEERTDQYLLFPGCDTVGLKQRDGKLQVKAIVGSPRPFSAGPVVGRIDQWVKWSFAPADKERSRQLGNELSQSGVWQKIRKRRHLQKYSFDSGRLAAIPPTEKPEVGCSIELTRIVLEPQLRTCDTLGFEAFGSPARVLGLLDEAVKHFFTARGPAPLPLGGCESLNYPAWLALSR